MRKWVAVLLLAPTLLSFQRVTLNGDWITSSQLYKGLLIGASPDWTPVPDVPCIVTYTPAQGIKETCYPDLFPSGGVIEDLRIIGNSLYASGRGDTSWGRVDAVYLLKYENGFRIIARLGKERWGSPYIQNALTLMAPLEGNRIALIVELLNKWGNGGITDIRLVLLDTNGNLLKDVSIANLFNLNVDRLFYNIAGEGKYLLVAQAWAKGGLGYRVFRINVDDMSAKVLDEGRVLAYTLAVARLYPVNGKGKEYVAVYYLLENGTFVFKAYGQRGLVFSFSRTLPLDILSGASFGCCRPKMKVITSFIAYDGGFYVPLSLLVDTQRGPAWIELLLGARGAYAFDVRRESWGLSIARVREWNSLLVSGCDACGEGYAYALPDPGGPIKFEEEKELCPAITVTKTVTVTETVSKPVTRSFISKSFEELIKIYNEVSNSLGFKAILLKAPFQRNVLYLSTLERLNNLYNKLLSFNKDLSKTIERLRDLSEERPTFKNVYEMVSLVQRAKVDIAMKLNTLKEMGELVKEMEASVPSVSCEPNKAKEIILGILNAKTIKEIAKYRAEASKMGGLDAVVKCLIKKAMLDSMKRYEELKVTVENELRRYMSEVKKYEAILKYLSVR